MITVRGHLAHIRVLPIIVVTVMASAAGTADHQVMLRPRSYQQEMIDQSLKQNIIVAVSTSTSSEK